VPEVPMEGLLCLEVSLASAAITGTDTMRSNELMCNRGFRKWQRVGREKIGVMGFYYCKLVSLLGID
jgi:hypothetical protein